jgi:hypothetical protein
VFATNCAINPGKLEGFCVPTFKTLFAKRAAAKVVVEN